MISFRSIPIFFFLAIIFAAPVLAFQTSTANTDGYLSNPRRAVHTFLHWQQQGHQNLDRVILPMQLSEGDKEEKVDLATELRKVLDARGLLVVYENIPNNPAFTDSLSGLNQYILFDELPEVYLVKRDNKWVFSEATVEQIPILYRNTFNSLVEALLDQLPEWANKEWFGVEIWQYLAVLFWLFIGVVLRKIFEFILDNYIRRLTKKTKFYLSRENKTSWCI